jgi:dCMP deaminase
MRPTKEEYFMSIAQAVSARSTCLRARAGAIIVKDFTIISTGYNGSARGEPNCCNVGICERDRLGLKPGERYELCCSIHAENNAIINAARNGQSIVGGTMYIYFERLDGRKETHGGPCVMCSRIIKNAGITDWKLKEVV